MLYFRRQFSHSTFYILHSTLIFLLLALFSFSCSKATSPETGAISGRVILENDTTDSSLDPIDYSGVTVALYNLAVLDTTLVRINQEYPHIGIIISQETEFDHRYQNPIATTETDPDGNFMFNNIPVGKYNLAFFKENWSLRYHYNQICYLNEVVSIGEITLLPIEYLSGVITTPFTFKANKQYIMEDNVGFADEVTIENRTLISVNQGKTITFYDALHTTASIEPGDYWKFTMSNGLNNTSSFIPDSTNYFGGLIIYNELLNLSNGIFMNMNNSLHISFGSAHLNNLYFLNFGNGLSFNQTEADISNIIIRDGFDKGCQVYGVYEQAEITSSIFLRIEKGIDIEARNGYLISNSYFIENNYAIKLRDCFGDINYNNYGQNMYDIEIIRGNNSIELNNFYISNNTCIFTSHSNHIINDNNFFASASYFISIICPYMNSNLDATLNYWRVSNLDSYFDYINNYQGNPYEIEYLPRRTSPVPNAGIQ